MSARIEDYALIGDCETAALVGRDGSIDWLCWPRFDSAACFTALLGDAEHGRWLIAPQGEITATRRAYRPDTLILETEFTTAAGRVRVTDFMPERGTNSDVVRIVTGLEGHVAMHTELVVRFDYGRTVPWVSRDPDDTLRMVGGPNQVVLRTRVALHGRDMKTVGEFTLAPGESVDFVLTYGASHLPVPDPIVAADALDDTDRFWREWTGQCTERGEWAGVIRRSLITLKALTYRPTGGIAAAATTSLPERIGGARNWDYRFCWLRDTTFTLFALMDGGFYEEAAAWRDWLLRAVAGSPGQMQIMYGLAGERDLSERELAWLPGYENSQPVRIGNAAAGQLQLDVYGEVADAFFHARRGGLPPSTAAWELQRALVTCLEEIWMHPDEGIWEVRGPRRHFVHSKVMAWVAFDRAVKGIEEFGAEGPLERWRAIRDQIHAEVCDKGFDQGLGSFVQSYGASQVDASLLLLPLVGFLPAADPRIRGTVAAIEQRLRVDGLLLRYDTGSGADGLAAGEGAFLACSFWFVDNLILQGRRDEAREMFERLLALCNDVGLLAEEYDPRARRMLGNVPQAFSHVALVNTAFNLTRFGDRADKRGDN
jgi:GH15 family glucan-1,4-alpha-glucosidase